MTHVAGHAIAWGMYKMRRHVGRIVWGSFQVCKRIGTTVLVDVEGGADLVPITIFNAHEMSLLEFAKHISERVLMAKQKKDVSHNKSTAGANFVPSFILQPILLALSYINVNLGVAIPFMGLKKDSVGHIILTNIGSIGMQQGIAPLCPPMRS